MDDNAEVRKNYYNTFFFKEDIYKSRKKGSKVKKASQIEQIKNLTYTEKKNFASKFLKYLQRKGNQLF